MAKLLTCVEWGIKMIDELFKYRSDYIDAYCELFYGHTNWEYAESADPNVAVTIIVYKKRDEDEN